MLSVVRTSVVRASRSAAAISRIGERQFAQYPEDWGHARTDLEQATGKQLEELEDFNKGIERFNSQPISVSKIGTIENPVIVPSVHEERIVGCAGGCTPDAPNWLRWFPVKANCINLCPDCSQAFVLSKEAALKPFEA